MLELLIVVCYNFKRQLEVIRQLGYGVLGTTNIKDIDCDHFDNMYREET
jgi:hypothetical protein